MRVGGLIYPVLLIVLGTFLLVVDLMTKRNTWVELGAFLTLLTGAMALVMRSGRIDRRVGLIIGIICTALAMLLAWRNYRSVSQDHDASSYLPIGSPYAFHPVIV